MHPVRERESVKIYSCVVTDMRGQQQQPVQSLIKGAGFTSHMADNEIVITNPLKN